jgi:hypothetical protein
MNPSDDREPNLFELRGEDGTQITYSTTSIAGTPEFSYMGPKGENAFSGDDIQTADSVLGREVTVTLESIPDARTTTLTLLEPPIRLGEGGSETFETLAIVVTRLTSIAGPPQGSAYRYEAVPLSGEASFVQF